MTLEQIESFLAVCEYGTILAASERLFVSQSTISSRILLLEEELGITLFQRKKGRRSIILTPVGEEFIPVAHHWVALWKDTQNLKLKNPRQSLIIGSVDLINNYTFVPLYNEMMDKHPEIKLSIRTHHSEEIYPLLSNNLIDIGYVFKHSNYPNIISRPVYRELMYLIAPKGSPYYDDIDPSKLEQKDEIYLNWGSDFEIWHNIYWPGEDFAISVNTGSMVGHYLTEGSARWSIVPKSLISVLEKTVKVQSFTLKISPPPRICYELSNRFPKPSTSETMQTYLEETERFIKQNESICIFEPWMLETLS